LVLLLTVKSGQAPAAPTHSATLDRSVLCCQGCVALHSSWLHAIYYISENLIGINAGNFDGGFVELAGRQKFYRAGTAWIWRKT
jgi:hypothetical protein